MSETARMSGRELIAHDDRVAANLIDDLREITAQDKAAIATQSAQIEGLRAEITKALGCFSAAYIEGLADTMAAIPDDEREPGSFFDLVNRRLLPAMDHLHAALSTIPEAGK